jgi:hypothetical protein
MDSERNSKKADFGEQSNTRSGRLSKISQPRVQIMGCLAVLCAWRYAPS